MSRDFIPVLCCSGGKTKDRFYHNGQYVKFVAFPGKVPQESKMHGVIFYKPDDKISGMNKTWRDLVLEQNHPDLVPAYKLYKPEIFRELYHEFGNRFYILSAGWGIIRANFKIPAYDITYSTAQGVPEYARRKDNYGWKDFTHLEEAKFDSNSESILFAGSDYVDPFCRMAQSIRYRKKILYKSRKVIRRPGFDYEYYQTSANTNWHYVAAKEYESFSLNNHKGSNEITHVTQKRHYLPC